MKIKAIITPQGGYQGMIEYIPGKYAHRPVEAEGYLFIHCLFVGFRKEYKGKGFANLLIDECINEAQKSKMLGVAVVTRKGSFMVDNRIFLKKGFLIVDNAEPDFQLLVLKFNQKAKEPKFKQNFPLKYFLGDNENAIKIQIYCALIANLLMTVIQKTLKRNWAFSNLVSFCKIHLFNYIHILNFLENPDKDWQKVHHQEWQYSLF